MLQLNLSNSMILNSDFEELTNNLKFLQLNHNDELEIGLYHSENLVAEILVSDHDLKGQPLYIMQVLKDHVGLFDLKKLSCMKEYFISSYNEFHAEHVVHAKNALKNAIK